MTFWSGERLIASSNVVSPFSKDQVDCNAYTLRMGDRYYRTSDEETNHLQKKTFLGEGESFLIPAGQFAYLLTKEEVNIPTSTIAFISMRTGVKFQGLINVSGFHVDPGYCGKLIFAVYNASPSSIQICENDLMFKIWFCDMDRKSAEKHIYADSGIQDIDNDLVKGMNKEILSQQSMANKIRDLESMINAKFAEQRPVLDNLTFIWRTAILSVTVAVVVTAFTAIATATLPSIYQGGKYIAEYFWPENVDTSEPVVQDDGDSSEVN